MKHYLFAAFALVAGFVGSATAAPPSPPQTLQSAGDVLDELTAIPLKGIPPAMLADAEGVAIIPRVIKAGFILGGRGGHGVVLSRDRNGAWGNPTFITLGGASIGFQAGVESADVVLIFKKRKSLDRILEGKGKVTLGADAAIAAGPVGRQAEAGTDGRLEAEIVSYSRSRGLFAGVALDGAAIVNDRDSNADFARDTRPEVGKLVESLKGRLNVMSGAVKVAPAGPPVMVSPPALAPVTPVPVRP